MKILHIADIHLGRRRLDGQLPDQDFAAAFDHIVGIAIEEQVDLFLIAGDLFDRPQVEPPHLGQALRILRRLKAAEIPVIAIEGNHDKAFIHSDLPTWVHHLAEEDLLILLQPKFGPDGAILEPWNNKSRSGSWFELGGIRFVGAGYLGAATPNKVRQIVAAMDDDATNVLLLHAGPDYFVGEGGGFSSDDLAQLKEKVCYLALGHIHKPMLHGGWACNPGSPENCDLNESRYGLLPDGTDSGRGYAMLEIDPNRDEPLVSLGIRSNPRRPIHRIELNCTSFGNKTRKGAEAFVEAAFKAIRPLAPSAESIVDLRLTGKLNLNRIALDPRTAADEIKGKTGVYAVVVDPTGLNIDSGFGAAEGGVGEGVSRAELEKAALKSLVEEESLWGLVEEKAEFAELFYQLKESVLQQKTEDQLAEQISASPLVDKVKEAKAFVPGEAESVEEVES